MNRLKHLFLALLCIGMAATSLTSCLSNDDNGNGYTPPTTLQKDMAIAATAGTYDGKIAYMPSRSALAADTAKVSYSVSDSTLVMGNFPLKVFNSYVTDENVRTLLTNAPLQSLTFNLHLYAVYNGSQSAGNYYQFELQPKYNDYKCYTSFMDGDTKHTVTISFWSYMSVSGQAYYSLLAFQDSNMAANIIVEKVEIDGKSYEVHDIYLLKGKKK